MKVDYQNILILILFLMVVYLFCKQKKNKENFSVEDESLDDLISKKIKEHYTADIDSIKTLAFVSKKLASKSGYILPGNIKIDGQLQVDKISGKVIDNLNNSINNVNNNINNLKKELSSEIDSKYNQLNSYARGTRNIANNSIKNNDTIGLIGDIGSSGSGCGGYCRVFYLGDKVMRADHERNHPKNSNQSKFRIFKN